MGGEPDEATTSLRAHLPGPCLRNDQPLTVYVAASPLLSLSLPFASLLSASQPPSSRAGCLALLVSLCLSGSACLALLVSLCPSRSASRSICLALPVPLCLFYTVHPALSVPRCLSGCACLALPVWLCLSRSACLALLVSLCLSRPVCLALPVWLCLSGSACLPVWLCSALQCTHPVCCRTTRDGRQLAHEGMPPFHCLHTPTHCLHTSSPSSVKRHFLPDVYEY